MIKQELITLIEKELLSKIAELKSDIQALTESRNNDTKSSAGDKYETSREMAQIELNKLEVQLSKISLQHAELLKIKPENKTTSIDIGSVVYTNHEHYFISIPFGKITCRGKLFYAISSISPLGSVLLKKKLHELFDFQGRSFEILALE